MSQVLIEELKRAQGYTDETQTCKQCVHHYERGMGEHMCELNPACHFRVNPAAHCGTWTRQESNDRLDGQEGSEE